VLPGTKVTVVDVYVSEPEIEIEPVMEAAKAGLAAAMTAPSKAILPMCFIGKILLNL
jgi:hypothetical protein